MMVPSSYKRKQMTYGAVIGAVVGIAIFGVFYAMNPSFTYIFFVPIAAAMGWASQYIKNEEEY